MNIELAHLITWGLTLIGLVGAAILRDRQHAEAVRRGDDVLHQRINKVRDEYVRRDDLNSHIERIERSIEGMHTTQQETNRRIDMVLVAVNGAPATPVSVNGR
jgi:uncharacterized protein YlxW (UPF0749 family)